MKDVYAIITERISTLLEQGVVPWQKPWRGGEHLPRNLISGHPYRGVNTFMLHAMAFESPFWLTFKQAENLGGHVRKGERSTPVVFWKWLEVEDRQTHKPERVPFLRYYSVFNVAQCDGIEAHVPKLNGPTRDHNAIAEAEAIVANMPKRPNVRLGGARACYWPALDWVDLPRPECFKTAEDFYSVQFHELTHATGHESRLNRKGVAGSEGNWSAFGSAPYAREELVAEMGAAFLCGHAGIMERTLDNSASYIRSWLERM